MEGLKWIVWEREQVAGEEEGPFWRTSSASIGGPEESYVYGYVSGRIIEWMRKAVERWRLRQVEKVSVREEMMPVLYRFQRVLVLGCYALCTRYESQW